ncbi:hypothetical protein WHR41_03471 [Cladosporium halotolerans]|uniref:Uncharacterized protein n=1 Tax=Cladosporium halotolerans TaxID=1052096 RepID=A0AB34KU91_9PEZI
MLCKCPHLTPLQSRLTASLLALALVAITLWALSNPHFAYAADPADGESHSGEDHNWHRIDELEDLEGDELGLLERQDENEPELVGISANNAGDNLNILAGQTARWRYPERLLHGPYGDRGAGLPSPLFEAEKEEGAERHEELRRRDLDGAEDGEGVERRQTSSEPRTVFVSINTCLQPTYNGTGTQSSAPPQLTLYVGTSADNERPGPDSSGGQVVVPLDEGFAHANITASDDIYLAVHAPQPPDTFTGGWNYEIAVSIDDYYHKAENATPFMFLVDTDTTSALLVTDNLTQADNGSEVYSEWMNLSPPPFMMFAGNSNYTRSLGLSKSFCGLKTNAQMQASSSDTSGTISHIEMGMVSRGLGNKPKQQFYVSRLNSSSGYFGTLAMEGNSTASGPGVIGGGGTVWAPTDWQTKADGNCALMFDLSFCSEVAYAVPANSLTYPSRDSLAARYDSYAAALYANFTYSMQQVACNASSDSAYSPSRSCEDCADAYKEWLCAVTIPRCEDFSAEYDWLQPRNVAQTFANGTSLPFDYLNASYVPMEGAPTLPGSPAWSQTYMSTFATNRSRNHEIIDLDIMPGPYKEVLPCEDLCYSLVQKCPASMGIGCPSKKKGLERSYGTRDDAGKVKCSYLGAVFYQNGAGSAGIGFVKAAILALAATVWLIL